MVGEDCGVYVCVRVSVIVVVVFVVFLWDFCGILHGAFLRRSHILEGQEKVYYRPSSRSRQLCTFEMCLVHETIVISVMS
jgi:hypothetical protein